MRESAPTPEIRAGHRQPNPAFSHTFGNVAIKPRTTANMDPPHFLLDALKDSITSGTFIDTKFYVFSRRDASGHVGSPRPLYCNAHVLDKVSYFSTRESRKYPRRCESDDIVYAVFSDGFSEGQARNINEGFPSDSLPHTEDYDYLSDSDLEDESSCSGGDEDDPQFDDCTERPAKEDEPNPPKAPRRGWHPQVSPPAASGSPPQVSQGENEVENNHKSAPNSLNFTVFPADFSRSSGNDCVRMGKVAIIRDIAAVTYAHPRELLFMPN